MLDINAEDDLLHNILSLLQSVPTPDVDKLKKDGVASIEENSDRPNQVTLSEEATKRIDVCARMV